MIDLGCRQLTLIHSRDLTQLERHQRGRPFLNNVTELTVSHSINLNLKSVVVELIRSLHLSSNVMKLILTIFREREGL